MASDTYTSEPQSVLEITPTSLEDSESNTNIPPFLVASSLSELEHIIENCPIIDNHAHPLLTKQTAAQFKACGLDLITSVSEANADSLKDVPNALVYHRAFKILQKGFSHLYPSEKGIQTWEDWKRYRDGVYDDVFTKECFSGLQTILFDHGLRYPDNVSPNALSWHDEFLKSPSKGIVRLETVAEDILTESKSFDEWEKSFLESIRFSIREDENTVGFKSIICYRTGLNITPISGDDTKWRFSAQDGYEKTKLESKQSGKGPKINDLAFNTYIVNLFAWELTKYAREGGRAKPIQFHTGLGDSDLRLKDANPVLMQTFVEAYPALPVVLLHAAYPYTREAGYLASTYQNVYLDFGLVFPMVSQEGQESIVKQVLELTPSSKAMWSTDGHCFGETYYLATRQMREVFRTVMGELFKKDSIGVENISNIVTDVLFNTANRLYNLQLDLYINPPQGWAKRQKFLTSHGKESPGHRGLASLKLLNKFLAENPGVEYLRISFLDYSAILRTRVVKLKQVMRQLESNSDGSVIGIVKAGLFLLTNCVMTDGANPCGENRLVPDFTSIRLHPYRRDGETVYKHASVMAWMEDEETGKPVDIDTRAILEHALSRASQAGLSDFKIGFEIEFCMFKQSDLDEGNIVPINTFHTWTVNRSLQNNKAMEILEEIDQELTKCGIEIEQFHSEAARGQYEMALRPLPPMQAVDTLLHTREVMQWVCSKHGYRATMIPKPYDNECGNASHMHMSFKPVDKQWSFWGGVLEDIRALNAMTLGGEMSYERVVSGFWAGGVWACWGKQNREAPLRLVEEDKAHWELKTVDGMANMYLAVAGVITAGTIGVTEGKKIRGKSDKDSARMTKEEREKRGITVPMVSSVEEAIQALFEADGHTPTPFAEAMGPGFAKHLAAVKKGEKEHVLSQFVRPVTGKIETQKRRAWAAQWY